MPEQVSLETARFEGIDGRTRLTMRRVFGSVEERDEMVAAGMENGVRDSMERLAEALRPGRVVVDITMSLDGYVTAPGVDLEHGLGVGGEALHAWVFSQTPREQAILTTTFKRTGAVIMGRRLFDIIDGPQGWNEEMGYGAHHAALPPVFVVTHTPPATVRLGPRFRFVTEGLAAAVEQARAAAGDEGKDVVIMGGGDVIAQSIAEGLADELRLHLAPLVLGGGTPLFPAGTIHELEQQEVRVSRYATHLRYAVRRADVSA
jgi:dihydrofolate reductase